jgi:hypothetical protein
MYRRITAATAYAFTSKESQEALITAASRRVVKNSTQCFQHHYNLSSSPALHSIRGSTSPSACASHTLLLVLDVPAVMPIPIRVPLLAVKIALLAWATFEILEVVL